MNALRTFGLASIFAASFTLVACDGESGLAGKSPQERVDAVKSAISKPSGHVDKTSVKAALDVSLSESKFQAMSTFLQDVPGLYGSGNASCSEGSSSDGKVDLKCSSGGTATGSVSYKIESSVGAGGTKSLVEMKFEDVCQNDTCIDGSMVLGVETSAGNVSTIMQGSLDMTEGGTTTSGEWGMQVTSSESGASVDIAVFDDLGDSYVLSTAVSSADAAGSVKIKGSNGEFSCTFDGGGASGSCSGSGEFSW